MGLLKFFSKKIPKGKFLISWKYLLVIQLNRSERDSILFIPISSQIFVEFSTITSVERLHIYARKLGHPWWRHQMVTFTALLALCAGNSPVTGEFPAQRPVTRSCDVLFNGVSTRVHVMARCWLAKKKHYLVSPALMLSNLCQSNAVTVFTFLVGDTLSFCLRFQTVFSLCL